MAKRITQLSELSTAAQDDYIVIVDTSSGTTKKITVKNLTGLPDTTWTATGESWSFSSFSTTTRLGVMNVPSDATTKYSVGMYIRFIQSTGGTKWGVITAVTSTTITIYFSSSYTLNNEAITSPVYSALKQPFGLPSIISDVPAIDSNTIATPQTTTSTSYADLATVGPSATVNVGKSGKVLVVVSAEFFNSGGSYTVVGFVVSGANTIAETQALDSQGTNTVQAGNMILVTGLNPGSTTFKLRYKVSAGTSTFLNRFITVIPQP